MTFKGFFIDFYLPYRDEKGPVSAPRQAELILNKAKDLLNTSQKGVAILYSANYGQTRKIQRAYCKGEWKTETNGSNQAAVIHSIESFLSVDYQKLQNTLRILPITTMNAYEDPVQPWNNDVLLGIVITDLERIKAYLDSGWAVLGWQNQNTAHTKHPYAIGGGIAQLPEEVSNKIQKTLREFAQNYPDKSDKPQ